MLKGGKTAYYVLEIEARRYKESVNGRQHTRRWHKATVMYFSPPSERMETVHEL